MCWFRQAPPVRIQIQDFAYQISRRPAAPINIPLALLLSALWPFGVKLLLLLGGAYLCVEGAAKVFDWGASWVRGTKRRDAGNKASEEADAGLDAVPDAGLDVGAGGDQREEWEKPAGEGAWQNVREALLKQEKSRVWAAVWTDFVLSAEIVVIALGMTSGQDVTLWY